MADDIITPHIADSLANSDGTPTQSLHTWMEQVTRRVDSQSDGGGGGVEFRTGLPEPEGAVSAPAGTIYVATGDIQLNPNPGQTYNISSGVRFIDLGQILEPATEYQVSFNYDAISASQVRVTTQATNGGDGTNGVIIFNTPSGSSGTASGVFTSTGTYFALEAVNNAYTGTISSLSVIQSPGDRVFLKVRGSGNTGWVQLSIEG